MNKHEKLLNEFMDAAYDTGYMSVMKALADGTEAIEKRSILKLEVLKAMEQQESAKAHKEWMIGELDRIVREAEYLDAEIMDLITKLKEEP